jgi:hypothetical protein
MKKTFLDNFKDSSEETQEAEGRQKGSNGEERIFIASGAWGVSLGLAAPPGKCP